MLNETFRYAVSKWLISSEEESSFHPIKQEEIEFLLGKILFFMESNETKHQIEWVIKKTEEDFPEKISSETISHLKKIAFVEMKRLITNKTKNEIPREFLDDNLYFSKKHIFEL